MRPRGPAVAAAPSSVAFLAVATLGALALLAAWLLGPALGDLIRPAPSDFFPEIVANVLRPEPTELARFAIAVAVPMLIAVAVLASRGRELPAKVAFGGELASLALPPFLVVCLAVAWFSRSEPEQVYVSGHADYFGTLAGAFALCLAAAVAWAAASLEWRQRAVSVARRRNVIRIAVAIAVLMTVVFLLPAVFTDANFAGANPFIQGHLPTAMGDTESIVAGLTPMVDHANQYVNLLPYLIAVPLGAAHFSPAATSITLTILSAISLLALYRALVVVTRSELAGAALYLPVLAVSLVPITGSGDFLVFNATIYPTLPERYLLPCLIAWLCARQLRGLRPTSTGVLFFVAGLAFINNPDFGGSCLIATLVSVLIGRSFADRRALGRLVIEAAAGVLAAIVVVALFTVARSGELPDPGLLFYFSRLFGSQGFGLVAMPAVGFWWIAYATFGGALVLAAVRKVSGDPDRALTGMLAFAGMFGLVAGVYYAGRSNHYSMIGLFPAWGFTVALLAWVVVRRIAAGAEPGWPAIRRAGPLGLATLAALGLATSALGTTPAPWDQISRLGDHAPGTDLLAVGPQADFVEQRTHDDEPVLILRQSSDLIAHDAGVEQVSIVSDPFHIASFSQLDDQLERLNEAGGSTVFTGPGLGGTLYPSIESGLQERGFEVVDSDPAIGITEWRPADGGAPISGG